MNKLGHKVLLVTALVAGTLICQSAQAASLPAKFPRLGNMYLSPTMTEEQASQLASWDVVILGIENQYTNPEHMQLMRRLNPDIIILAYITSEEMPTKHLSISDPNHPLYKLVQGISNSWWLTDPQGQRTGFWPGSNMLNVSDYAPIVNGERWNTYLPKFMHSEVMATGLWSGIFYDNIFPNVSWVNNGQLDLNGDGLVEAYSIQDASWERGLDNMLSLSRQLEGPNTFIVGNGAGQYYPTLHGRFMEEFPSLLDGEWPGAMNIYFDVLRKGLSPSMVVVNGTTRTGQSTDYQRMRYVMTSTLLGNGFFSFDFGSIRHADLWQYDEYQVYLGLPLATARSLHGAKVNRFQPGVWRRDFQNGIVLVNSTAHTQTVTVGSGFTTLHGIQDQQINSGKKVSQVSLAPHDGMILLKERLTVAAGQYVNGGLTTVTRADGKQAQGGFTHDAAWPLRSQVTVADLNHDGRAETMVADKTRITVYDFYGRVSTTFQPYPKRLSDPFTVSVGDMNGDRQLEIITAPQHGLSEVCVFSRTGKKSRCFRAYDKTYLQGVSVALGDVNGDGRAEIITAKAKARQPATKIFDRLGKLQKQMTARSRPTTLQWSLASGDLTRDGKAEILIASSEQRTVTIVNRQGKRVPGVSAKLPTALKPGATFTISDINRDGTAEVFYSVFPE